jgi:hypothetical protein
LARTLSPRLPAHTEFRAILRKSAPPVQSKNADFFTASPGRQQTALFVEKLGALAVPVRDSLGGKHFFFSLRDRTANLPAA